MYVHLHDAVTKLKLLAGIALVEVPSNISGVMEEGAGESWTLVQPRSSRGVKEVESKYQHRERDASQMQHSRETSHFRTRGEKSQMTEEHFRTKREAFRTSEEHYRTREDMFKDGTNHIEHLSDTTPEPSQLASRGSMSDKIGRPIKLHSTREGPAAIRKQPEYNNYVGLGSQMLVPGSQRGILRIKPTAVSPTEREDSRITLEKDDEWPTIFGGPSGGKVREDGGGGSTSWSAVVQSTRQPFVMKKKAHIGTKGSDVSESDEEDELKTKKKSKRKKKKKKGASQPEEQHLDQPLMLELGSMLDALTDQKSSTPKVIVASGGAVPLGSRNTKPAKNTLSAGPRNVLDSNAPVVHRGKERETPKAKKPTALRKVIQKEKDEKKRLKDGEPVPEDQKPIEGATSDKGEQVPKIHNRKFREYCTHMQTEDINTCVQQLLSDLVRFQDRQYLKDPIKAKARRRYVCGFKEVTKHLKLRKLKCVIIPPNLDRIQFTGGIDDLTEQIISLSNEQGISTVFAMSRRRLAYVLKKNHKVGCVGIFSYDGAEVHYRKLMQLMEEATKEYQSKVSPQTAVSPPTDATVSEDLSLSQDSSSSTDSLSSGPDYPIHGNGTQSVEHWDRTQSLKHGNGMQSLEHEDGTRSKPLIMSTPWGIFFGQKADSAASNSQKDSDISKASGRPQIKPRTHKASSDAVRDIGAPIQTGTSGDTKPRTQKASRHKASSDAVRDIEAPIQTVTSTTPGDTKPGTQKASTSSDAVRDIEAPIQTVTLTTPGDTKPGTQKASRHKASSDAVRDIEAPIQTVTSTTPGDTKPGTHKASRDVVRDISSVPPIPGDLKSRYCEAQLRGKGIQNGKATGFEFNVFAEEFQPSFKFDLNINAPEFTPTGAMNPEM